MKNIRRVFGCFFVSRQISSLADPKFISSNEEISSRKIYFYESDSTGLASLPFFLQRWFGRVGEYDNGKGTWTVEKDKLITMHENGDELIYTLLKVTDKELITQHEVELNSPEGTLIGEIILSYSR